MNKKAYIYSLKNVKIVLGNGFDLHCGLYTKYSDYYCENLKKYLFIKRCLESYKNNHIFNLKSNHFDIHNINVWDVFFAINGPVDPVSWKRDWCDIERLIYFSLTKTNDNLKDTKNIAESLFSTVKWNVIESLILNNSLGKNDEDRFVVEFIKQKSGCINYGYHDFFDFLLKELKMFEKSFGEFVYEQIHDRYLEISNHGLKIFLNDDYQKAALHTINELCNINDLTSVDSFNYTTIEIPQLKDKFQNINGSFDNPIFGIDTKFSPKDKEYIFTKTSRRIDSDIVDNTLEIKPYFENIVIYGHSLNEADYSYFFPLFDKLNLLDSTATGVVVFAYSIFDESKKEDIESTLRSSMANIILEYAKSKNVSNPNRLLDSLSTQKRVFTYLVSNNRVGTSQKTSLDALWEEKYKNMDLMIKNEENTLQMNMF